MNNSNSHYYAWIPSLTNGISIEKGFETILEKYEEESSHTYTSKKPHIEKDIKNKKGREFDIKIILDADKKVKTVQRKEEILKLTFISTMIGVVGAIIGIILSLDALHNLGVSWLITLIIMLVISILIVLTLGILLIKPIESRILKLLEKI